MKREVIALELLVGSVGTQIRKDKKINVNYLRLKENNRNTNSGTRFQTHTSMFYRKNIKLYTDKKANSKNI